MNMKFYLIAALSIAIMAAESFAENEEAPMVPLDLVFPFKTIELVSTDNELPDKKYDEPLLELYVVKEVCSDIIIENEDPVCVGFIRYPVCVPKSAALKFGVPAESLKKAKLCESI